ncbi:hypothetical protein [Nocardia sp. NPDC004860]|uniref:TRADD-N-associated membrane domain-containing protein n=1 Tax=Nocardia sp. NPDC004860 TaxID=3154557 RepID=UPI0033B16271
MEDHSVEEVQVLGAATNGGADLSDTQRERLLAERAALEAEREELLAKQAQHKARALLVDAQAIVKSTKSIRRVFGAITVVGVVAFLAVSWNSDWRMYGIALASVTAAFGLTQWLRTGDVVIRGESVVAKANVYAALEELKGPDDLLGLLKLNRRQMDAYDVAARRQGSASHWMSMAAMAVGLGIVGVGLWIAVTAEEDAAKYSAAIVAVAGTATGGYIAQTFIRVHSGTQEQVRFYFEQPLVQSYMLMAERAIAQMPAADQPAQFEKLVDAAVAQAAMVPRHRIGAPLNPEPKSAAAPVAQAE